MTRSAAAAGSFYPADPVELARTIDDMLVKARVGVAPGAGPDALVVPHAGYGYSGPVAASAFALLHERPRARVVLLGPAHFVSVRGIAAPADDVWELPLGAVAIDDDLRSAAVEAGVWLDDRPHAREHSLEVQLPFLARIFGEVTILPLAIGSMSSDEVADAVATVSVLADLVVVSTDLSHYLDRTSAERVDQRTAEAVVARDPGAIADGAACGVHALRGIAAFARRCGLPVRVLDVRTSAETGGDPRRVVGYGAFAIG